MREIELNDHAEFFQKIARRSFKLNYPGSDREPVFIDIEDLYRLFKARMMAELLASADGSLNERSSPT